jgi:hypothetical protein
LGDEWSSAICGDGNLGIFNPLYLREKTILLSVLYRRRKFISCHRLADVSLLFFQFSIFIQEKNLVSDLWIVNTGIGLWKLDANIGSDSTRIALIGRWS